MKWFENYNIKFRPHQKFTHKKVVFQNGGSLHFTEGDKRKDGYLIIELPNAYGEKKVYSYRVTASNSTMMAELFTILLSAFDALNRTLKDES